MKTLACQQCQTPITSQSDEKGRKILEFYSKFTGQTNLIVCHNCLLKPL